MTGLAKIARQLAHSNTRLTSAAVICTMMLKSTSMKQVGQLPLNQAILKHITLK